MVDGCCNILNDLTMVVLILGLIISVIGWKSRNVNDYSITNPFDKIASQLIPPLTFIGFHLIFIALGLLYGIWIDLPLLLVIGLTLFTFHIYIHKEAS